MSAQADLEADLPPEELIPGDLSGVDLAAAECTMFGDQLAETRKGVQYIELNGTEWTGQAAEIYFAVKDADLTLLDHASGVFDDAATALTTYADALRDARQRAAEAREEYKKGKAAEQACAPGTPTLGAPPLLQAPAIPITNQDLANVGPSTTGAIAKLTNARSDLEEAGADAAAKLKKARDLAPFPVPPLDDGGLGFGDLWDTVKGAGTATWSGLRGWTLGLEAMSSGDPTKMEGLSEQALDAYGDAAREGIPAAVTLLSLLAMFAGVRGVTGGAVRGPQAGLGAVVDRDLVTKELALLAEKRGLTLAEVQDMKSGIGPVLKGQAGVNAIAKTVDDAGYTVLGRETTVKVVVDGTETRVRPDLLIGTKDGKELAFVDVKTGPNAHLQPNQGPGYDAVRKDGFIPTGENAARAGLDPGTAHDPIPVWEVYVAR